MKKKKVNHDVFVINRGGVENSNVSGTETGLIVSDKYVQNVINRIRMKRFMRRLRFDYVSGNMRTKSGLSTVETGYTFTKAQRYRVIVSKTNPFANLSVRNRTFVYSENTLILEKTYEGNKLFNFIFEEKNEFYKKHRYFLTLRQKPLKK
jgi:hypothetical protein